MEKNKQAAVTITAVFLFVQAGTMIALLYKGHNEYFRSVAVTTCFWLVYTFLEIRYQVRMSNYIRVLMVLAIFFDAFFGYCFDLYAGSFVFDKALHIFGSYAVSLFAYVLVMQLQAGFIDQRVRFILVLGLGLTIGVGYEILEFITDTISHPVPPSQPSLLDTDIDLIGDFIGASLAGIHAVSRKFIN